jgi:hypothetical protein
MMSFMCLCRVQERRALFAALLADEHCPASLREVLMGLFIDVDEEKDVEVDRERIGVSSCAARARRKLSALLPALPPSARHGSKPDDSLLLLVERMVNIFTRVEKSELTAQTTEEKEEVEDVDDYAFSSLSKRQVSDFVDLSVLWVIQDAMNHLALLRELDNLHPRELAQLAMAIDAFDTDLTGRVEEADVPALLQHLARVAGTEPYTPEEVIVALFELAEEADREGEGQEGISLAACAHWWVRE